MCAIIRFRAICEYCYFKLFETMRQPKNIPGIPQVPLSSRSQRISARENRRPYAAPALPKNIHRDKSCPSHSSTTTQQQYSHRLLISPILLLQAVSRLKLPGAPVSPSGFDVELSSSSTCLALTSPITLAMQLCMREACHCQKRRAQVRLSWDAYLMEVLW